MRNMRKPGGVLLVYGGTEWGSKVVSVKKEGRNQYKTLAESALKK